MTSRWAKVLLAFGVFGVAMAPRSSTWSGTFRGPLVLLEEVDAYYHLRRIELALANDLVLPAVDTYNNHPFGATVDWPPGFDLLFAVAWHLLSQVTPETVSPAAVGAVGVAVLGSLAAAAAAVVASRWGPWSAVCAGLAVAWSPAAVAYSRVGRLDHHAIEPLWLVVLCATYAWTRACPSPSRAAVLGLVLALGTAFWPGLAFYAALLAAAFALEARRGAPSVARGASVAYLVAAALSALLALASPWGRELEVVYYALSWFQPLVFGALAAGFTVAARLESRGAAPRRAWALGGVALGAAAAVALALAAGSIGRGLDFLLRSDPVAATVLESRSLVELGPGYALRWLTPVGMALPLLLGAAAVLALRRDRLDPLLAAALALGALALPFAVLQMRFGPHAAVASAFLAAWLLAQAPRAGVAVGALAVTVATLGWGVRPATLPDSAVHPYLLGGFDALVWLRQAPPRTSHFRQPWRHPEYGVAAEWVWGHWITQIGQKPNVANPLAQTPRNLEGIEEVARLFLAESDAEALASLERLDVRYLLLSSIPVTVSELALQAGRDPDRYVVRDDQGSPTFRPPFFETFHSRLYMRGGAGEGGAQPVPGVRLVFESRVRIDFLGSRPAVRIFEVVPGARLRGRCGADGVEVRAELARTGLVYAARQAPSPDGRFEVILPYASESTGATIPARVMVRCGTEDREVEVAERAVLEGLVVEVDARPGPGT